jgi:predicted nucleic acid-binding Zn ribbon protein
MARRRRGSGPRRDWSKIIFYGLSILIVLSMVLSTIAFIFTS